MLKDVEGVSPECRLHALKARRFLTSLSPCPYGLSRDTCGKIILYMLTSQICMTVAQHSHPQSSPRKNKNNKPLHVLLLFQGLPSESDLLLHLQPTTVVSHLLPPWMVARQVFTLAGSSMTQLSTVLQTSILVAQKHGASDCCPMAPMVPARPPSLSP